MSESQTDTENPADEPAGSTERPVGRRSFLGATLGAGAILGAAGGLPNPLAAEPPQRQPQGSARPRVARNVIFMVSDGMSIGALQLANLYSRLKLGRPARWVELLSDQRVTRATIETSSANSHVTDSAAASCAWALGEKIDNGRIGWTPDGRTPTPILMHAKQSGKATGLVTTTRLTHATPAGFCANVPEGNRNHEDRIAVQLLERPIDVMLGGGGRYIEPIIPEHPGVFTELRTRDELLALDARDTSRRLLGVFARSHMAFELDRDQTEQPSLAEMTRVALERLDQHPGGFVLQVEGGRVDHAGHYNDAASMITDQLAFDEALRVALEYVESRDDTLLVVTADHSTGNPGLTDYTSGGIDGFARLLEARRSFDWIKDRIGDDLSTESVRQAVLEASGVSLSDRDIEFYVRWRQTGDPVDPFLLALDENHGPLGSAIGNHFKVGFVSHNHTSDFIELTALGPGAERFEGWMPIERIHGVLTGALDLPPARPV